MDFGSNCRLGVCFLHLICLWFYVYLSLVFRAYYHWWICLLFWLLSSLFFLNIFALFLYIYIYTYIYIIFPFSLFVTVYVYASLCVFVCTGLLLPFVLGFCLSSFFAFFKIFIFIFLPFLLSRVAGRVLELRAGVKYEPLGWEGRVQGTGPPETSWPHIISIG